MLRNSYKNRRMIPSNLEGVKDAKRRSGALTSAFNPKQKIMKIHEEQGARHVQPREFSATFKLKS